MSTHILDYNEVKLILNSHGLYAVGRLLFVDLALIIVLILEARFSFNSVRMISLQHFGLAFSCPLKGGGEISYFIKPKSIWQLELKLVVYMLDYLNTRFQRTLYFPKQRFRPSIFRYLNKQ